MSDLSSRVGNTLVEVRGGTCRVYRRQRRTHLWEMIAILHWGRPLEVDDLSHHLIRPKVDSSSI